MKNNQTTTGIKAIVKRITTGKIYWVSNIIQTSEGLFHRGDFFIASILVNGKCKGRMFNMERNQFEIIEIKEETQLSLYAE